MANYKKLSGSRVEFVLTLEVADFEKMQKKVIEEFKKSVSVKGFRVGHAPVGMVIASVGLEKIFSEAYDRVINKRYKEFLLENNLNIVNFPVLDEPKDIKNFPVSITVVVEVYPDVELGDYSQIKMPVCTPITVTDEEVTQKIILDAEAFSIGGNLVDRPAKKGDLVEVDFCAFDKKGEVIRGTEVKHERFKIGDEKYLPDLESAFIGMRSGEEKKEVGVGFPERYHSSAFAGKTIPFDIKLRGVYEIIVEDLTPEEIEKLNAGCQTLEDLKDVVRKGILSQKEQTEREKATEAYLGQFAKFVSCDLPKSWADREVAASLERVKKNPQFKQGPENFWKILGQTEESFKAKILFDWERGIKNFLGLLEAVKREKIELTEEELSSVRLAVHAHHHSHYEEDDADYCEDIDKELEHKILDRKIDKFISSAIMNGKQ